MQHTLLQPQRGITLLESLVAIVVMALGILGILGVQMRTLSDTQTGVRRAQAIRLIEDMGERMKANPSALANLSSYVSNFAASPTVPSCASGCTAANLATYDVAVWKRTVRESLPLGKASIFVAPGEADGNRRQLGVIVAWRENERDGMSTTDKAAINATLTAGAGTDTATNACPADHTCHLQYIIAPSRCAPYSPGGVTTYYCPGV
ncbi:MAG: type IV pilus modification protein PilV [Acidovorax sp.]|jgi:type IV pilus assembly protein PilV|nr:type IV pilus modification protein PilV [Acidovorax sp.]MBP8151046.1 type IV pilus modification protein PilV [Xylophilus sp.]